MPKGKNCPNCGAPFELGVDQCPFCGTIYFDLSCIDFTKSQPIFLKIKTRFFDGKTATITQKVLPELKAIQMEMEEPIRHQTLGSTRMLFKQNTPVIITVITFRSIEADDGSVATVIYEGSDS